MSLKISDECMACGRCASNCPIGCIYPGDLHYEIDTEACVGCLTCTTVCPISAISEQE